MSVTLNVRARNWAQRHLFLAEPSASATRTLVASLSVRELADGFCAYEECPDLGEGPGAACRLHTRAMILGVAKMIADHEVMCEMSKRGVLFVRLSAEGVLSPLGWSTPPHWVAERPELVRWAHGQVTGRADRVRWEAAV